MVPACLFLSALLLQTPAIPPQASMEKERGDNLVASNNLESAMRAYDEAIRLAPNYVEAFNQRGVTQVRLGRMEEAVASFEKALEIDPNYAMAVYNRGFALKKLGRHEDVVRAFNHYVALMPEDASGYFQLAEGNYACDALPEALAAYERFLAMEKNPSQTKKIEHAQKRVADLRTKVASAPQAQPQAPAALAPQAAPMPPKDVSPSSVLFVTPERESLSRAKMAEGVTLRAEGKLRESIFALQAPVQANPNDPTALHELAESYAAKEYFVQAAVRWEKVLAMNPAPAMRAQVQERLDEAYRQMEARGIQRQSGATAPNE